MAKPQHRTAAHRAARRSLDQIVKAGQAYCAEPICLMPDRWIAPGTPWHVSHDTTGTVVIGPSHARCNLTEAAIRGRAKQLGTPTRVPASRDW